MRSKSVCVLYTNRSTCTKLQRKSLHTSRTRSFHRQNCRHGGTLWVRKARHSDRESDSKSTHTHNIWRLLMHWPKLSRQYVTQTQTKHEIPTEQQETKTSCLTPFSTFLHSYFLLFLFFHECPAFRESRNNRHIHLRFGRARSSCSENSRHPAEADRALHTVDTDILAAWASSLAVLVQSLVVVVQAVVARRFLSSAFPLTTTTTTLRSLVADTLPPPTGCRAQEPCTLVAARWHSSW